jgi:hypothetical protein
MPACASLLLLAPAFHRQADQRLQHLSTQVLGGQADLFVQSSEPPKEHLLPKGATALEAPAARLLTQTPVVPRAPVLAPTPDGKIDCWGPLVDRQSKLFMGWSYRAGYQMAMSLFVDHLNDTQKMAQLAARLHIHESLGSGAMVTQANGAHVVAGEIEATLDKFRTEVLSKSSQCATRADWMNPSMFKFKVVRSPFARAVAIYHYQLSTSCGGKPRLQNLLAKALQLSTRDFTGVSFIQYLRALSTMGLDVFDAQTTPQIKQFEQSHSGYDYTCKVEEITSCLAQLNARANTSFGTLTLEQMENTTEPAVDVASEPFLAIRDAMPPVQHFYSGTNGLEAQQIVQALYKADFEAYNYSHTIPKTGLPLFLHFKHSMSGQRHLDQPWVTSMY